MCLDTNSGPITVEKLNGDLLADTGSGRVAAIGITGEVNVDTGSGSVHVANCQGSEVKVDTGSGSVEAEMIDCSYLLVFGTPEQVDQNVKETIKVAAPGGGYCLSSSNSIHSSVKPENFMAMVETLRECGGYS